MVGCHARNHDRSNSAALLTKINQIRPCYAGNDILHPERTEEMVERRFQGSLAGEQSFFLNMPRTATMRAYEDRTVSTHGAQCGGPRHDVTPSYYYYY